MALETKAAKSESTMLDATAGANTDWCTRLQEMLGAALTIIAALTAALAKSYRRVKSAVSPDYRMREIAKEEIRHGRDDERVAALADEVRQLKSMIRDNRPGHWSR